MENISKYIIPKNKFVIMIILSVIVACALVVVSLLIYQASGAAQVDLSRPGYVSVRDKAVKNDDDFMTFSGSGQINQKAIAEFKQIFAKRVVEVKLVDAFSGDPLSPESLGVDLVDEISN